MKRLFALAMQVRRRPRGALPQVAELKAFKDKYLCFKCFKFIFIKYR